ncbi:MAG: hypothetical protein KAI59_04775 [Planctomycetes bacterium]|nr:hypothetical protein [Planctomycetota bacterium]MCK5473323.1 hypothetical protein [Planctomycetota bacterium]
MSKMQIIAKAILTIIGISAITSIFQYFSYPLFTIVNISILNVVLFFAVLTILLVVIAYLFIFKNNWLASKIAGSGEKLNSENEVLWLTASIRIAAIFCGLILLPGAIPTMLKIVVFPIHMRGLINEIFIFGGFPKSINLTATQWFRMIHGLVNASLSAWLLCGRIPFMCLQPSTGKAELLPEPNQYREGIENE